VCRFAVPRKQQQQQHGGSAKLCGIRDASSIASGPEMIYPIGPQSLHSFIMALGLCIWLYFVHFIYIYSVMRWSYPSRY